VYYTFGQQNKIIGNYRSNFAELGFFVTQIELLPDSTFEYEFSGDLFYDRAKGKYKVHNDTIYFEYYSEKIDTTTVTYIDSTGKVFKYKMPPMSNYAKHLRPNKLYYRKRKLFAINSDEELPIKNDNVKGQTRRYYLIRRKGHILDER